MAHSANKITTVHVNNTDYEIHDAQAEHVDNMVQTIAPSATASTTKYPSEKAVRDALSASTAAQWGNITGTLANQTDLATALAGKVETSSIGTANGVAGLGADGKVPSAQLPSYVDDVEEYASLASFPATGESGKIYIAKDTNKTYRWSGTGYVEISASLALGETSSTAYRGDKGKTAYDHSQATGNPHGTTAAQITGLGRLATKDSASGSFTPAGTITTSAANTAKVNSITAVGTLPTFAATVTNEVLSFSFNAGTLPTKGADQTVATEGTKAPVFAGTAATVTVD